LKEIIEMIEAHNHEEARRDDVENQRTAWLASHLMTVMIKTNGGKKTIKSTDLYTPMDERDDDESPKEKKGVIKRFESPEQKMDYLADLKSKFGKPN
jgi:uncharacterized protein YabE (DUF348 family)